VSSFFVFSLSLKKPPSPYILGMESFVPLSLFLSPLVPGGYAACCSPPLMPIHTIGRSRWPVVLSRSSRSLSALFWRGHPPPPSAFGRPGSLFPPDFPLHEGILCEYPSTRRGRDAGLVAPRGRTRFVFPFALLLPGEPLFP